MRLDSDEPPGFQAAESERRELTQFLRTLVARFGGPPLQGMVDQTWSQSSVVLAHILNALLSSARISHEIAIRTLKSLFDEQFYDVQVLRHTTWDERTQILTKGGYTRYREKTATFLGGLIELLENEYGKCAPTTARHHRLSLTILTCQDNDASNILPKSEKGQQARNTISSRLRDIKGLGPVGIDIFLGSIQHALPSTAPFLDARSKETAQELGLGQDLDSIFDAMGSDASAMAELEVALTNIRLEGKQGQIVKFRT